MVIKSSTFLVTGGSSGLGAACVERLLLLGANVVVADLKPPAEGKLSSSTSNWTFQQTDVTDETSVQAAVDLACDRFGNFRGVVTCAGIIHGERIVGRNGAFDLGAFRRVIDVNLTGTFNVLRHAAAAMQDHPPDEEGERGAIVLTSSIAAFEGQIGQSAYAASKGGVAALTLPAARELGRLGIRVACIAPGVFETPMMQQVQDAYRQSLEDNIPFPRRFGRPDEFAALVVHILENRMLNGEVIRLDGGLRMPPK